MSRSTLWIIFLSATDSLGKSLDLSPPRQVTIKNRERALTFFSREKSFHEKFTVWLLPCQIKWPSGLENNLNMKLLHFAPDSSITSTQGARYFFNTPILLLLAFNSIIFIVTIISLWKSFKENEIATTQQSSLRVQVMKADTVAVVVVVAKGERDQWLKKDVFNVFVLY